MKTLILIFTLLLSCSFLSAQYQSRIISEVNSENAGGNMVKSYDDYLLIKFGYQTDEGNLATGIMKTDFDGNPLWITKIDSIFSIASKNTVFKDDGTFVTAGYRTDGIFDKNIQIISFDENGNTLEVKEYGEGWDGEELRTFFAYSNGYLLSFNVISEDNPSKSEPVLVRLDSNFEIVWEKKFTNSITDFSYYISRVWYDDNGNIYFSGSDGASLYNVTVLVKLDQNGNEIWKYVYPPNNYQIRGGVGTQLKDEDAFYLVNYIKEDISPVGHWHWVPEVIKVNYEGEFLWSNLILNKFPKYRSGIFERENNDYIVYGRGSHTEYEYNKEEGWLVIYNQENERLFQRVIVDQRYSLTDNFPAGNGFATMTELPDGSLVFVGGISLNNSNPVFTNQIWFVHTDAEGCLQENCGSLQIIDENGNYSTITAIEDIERNRTNPLSVKVYPNPAQDILNVELLGKQPHLERVELMNVAGRVLKVYFEENQSNFTLSLPANLKGLHFLKGYTESGVWIKKIAIE